MITPNNDILSRIPDAKAVRVFLPMKDYHERYSVHGVYRNSDSPYFNLHFDPDVLPVNSINCDGTCILNISIDGPTSFFEARITKIKNYQHLVMTALRQISHEQMRDFFRVKVSASVVVNPLLPKLIENEEAEFSLVGETIDISASGILASFHKQPAYEKQVKIKITLPTRGNEIISVIAHPVRTVKFSENHYNIAYHFDEISQIDREKIIESCLVLQRRQLRLKIRVKDL